MSVVLDAGAFIAYERGDRRVIRLIDQLVVRRMPALTHGGVIGQVWRSPARQVGLARLLRSIEIRPLDAALGRDAGRLLANAGSRDVIDAALVMLMRDGDVVLTSDPDDLVLLMEAADLHGEVVPV